MGDDRKTEEDRALVWWFGHTRQTELTGTGPVDSLVAMVREVADQREHETIARVVAWMRAQIRVDPYFDGALSARESRERDYLRSYIDRIERGDWRNDDGQ